MNKRARYARRVIREHRWDHKLPVPTRGWRHATKTAEVSGVAAVWSWWECARCHANEVAWRRRVRDETTMGNPSGVALHSWDDVREKLELPPMERGDDDDDANQR